MNGFGGADALTFAAGYTFCVANLLAVHKAGSLAGVTADTFAFVDLHGEKAELVKDCIKGSQGTEETAEGAIDDNGSND